ncbi:phosphotransferase [Bacillus sp. CGMCC 1.16607]|uniref:phosphotransferase n=1 Tax=Bacillus sp. CGMCC 1.16607 TaxID=3351842 RepID=UPI00363A3CDA
MEHLLGQEWEVIPAGGETGEAFFAQFEEQRLFLKRNSSPFLAVLSAEGIVPKLVWTKRLENGDVISAQQWMDGRELKPSEMNVDQVAKLLKKIHRSKPLLGMLKRLGKSPLKPKTLLRMLEEGLDLDLLTIPTIVQSLAFLNKEHINIQSDEMAVCHSDVNHNNWLLTDQSELFLIDWDGAQICDPAIDLGQLLHWYIPKSEWVNWLELYGIQLTEHLQLRMKWYVIVKSLSSIQWYKSKQRHEEMEKWIKNLERMF